MKTTKLPIFLKKYFWDVDFKKLDPGKDNQYMIVRLLERGDETVIKWLYKKYSTDLIKEVITTHRGLSPKTASLSKNAASALALLGKSDIFFKNKLKL